MAGFVYKPLFQAVATTSAVQVYIAPASTRAEVKTIHVCNTTAGVVTLSLWHDIDGTTYNDSSKIWSDIPIAPGETFQRDVTIEMAAASGGMAIAASANTSLTVTGYGWEFS